MRGLTQVCTAHDVYLRSAESHALCQFIADIRGARVRELEEKRINKEMANIRKRFKSTNGFSLSSSGMHFRQTETWTGIRRRSKLVYIFWRRPVRVYSFVYRYVAKVIFTYILGYKVDVGHMEAVNLISSSKYSEKQIVRSRLRNHYFA